MSKKQPVISQELHENEFDDWLVDESAQAAATDLLHGINLYINSAIELTKLIVEKTQNSKWYAQSILSTYNQSVETIGKSIQSLAKKI